MTLQLLQLPIASSTAIKTLGFCFRHHDCHSHHNYKSLSTTGAALTGGRSRQWSRGRVLLFVGKEETELRVSRTSDDDEKQNQQQEPNSEDLEYVRQIQRVLELLRTNRDMLFSEVKLTILIEDPREVERRRMQGIEDENAPTREDLVAALEEVNEGKIPEDRVALQMLADEMINWPNLEVEVPKKKRTKSLYATATDTGIDPQVAAKRLNMDWDTAAEIDEIDESDKAEVPPAVGYGALYLVTAFPIIIGISVVLILFYNSLQ